MSRGLHELNPASVQILYMQVNNQYNFIDLAKKLKVSKALNYKTACLIVPLSLMV